MIVLIESKKVFRFVPTWWKSYHNRRGSEVPLIRKCILGRVGTATRKYPSWWRRWGFGWPYIMKAEKLLGSAQLVQYATIISIQTTLDSITIFSELHKYHSFFMLFFSLILFLMFVTCLSFNSYKESSTIFLRSSYKNYSYSITV